MRSHFCPIVVSAGLTLLVASLSVGDQEVRLDHRTGLADPDGSIPLRNDEFLVVRLTTANPECFTFNTVAVEMKPPSIASVPPPTQEITWRFRHDGATTNYRIEIKKKPTPANHCSNVYEFLGEKIFDIAIKTYGWTVGAAGGYTVDQLVSPIYFLEKGKRDDVDGFLARERGEGFRSDYVLGAAAMVHLYHGDPEAFAWNGLGWAPVSFGLGVNNNQARYFVGTSIKFDTKFFLTMGRVFGSVDALPNNLDTQGFTTDDKALKTLANRTDSDWLFSISYTFVDIDLSAFSKPFKQKAPAPSTP